MDKKQRLNYMLQMNTLTIDCDGCKRPERFNTLCKGCNVATELQQIGSKLNAGAASKRKKRFQEIFDKGQAISKKDFLYLRSQGFSKNEVAARIKVSNSTFNEICRAWGLVKERKGELKVSSVKKMKSNGPQITKEAYEAMKREGKTDKFIQSYFGIESHRMQRLKRDWKLTGKAWGLKRNIGVNTTQIPDVKEEKFIAMKEKPAHLEEVEPVKSSDPTDKVLAEQETQIIEQKKEIERLNNEVVQLHKRLFETEDQLSVMEKAASGFTTVDINQALPERETKYFMKATSYGKALMHLLNDQKMDGKKLNPVEAALLESLG